MHLHVFYVSQFTENEFRMTCKVVLKEEYTRIDSFHLFSNPLSLLTGAELHSFWD